MFVFNVNLNKNRLKKFAICGLILLFITLIILFTVTRFKKDVQYVNDNTSSFDDSGNIKSENYTSILKDCYENIDKYIRSKN